MTGVIEVWGKIQEQRFGHVMRSKEGHVSNRVPNAGEETVAEDTRQTKYIKRNIKL